MGQDHQNSGVFGGGLVSAQLLGTLADESKGENQLMSSARDVFSSSSKGFGKD